MYTKCCEFVTKGCFYGLLFKFDACELLFLFIIQWELSTPAAKQAY